MNCGCPSPGELAAEVSYKAFKEALKDRVKKKMEASMGKKLDTIADLIVEGMAGHMEMHKAVGQKMETMQAHMQKKQEWMGRMLKAMME
jgi:hypothetical protein